MPEVSVEKPVTLDLLDPKKPGTSATSDMPLIETKPDVVVKKAAPDEGKTQDEPATPDEPGDTPANAAPKPAKGVQKRIDELTRQREDERRARLDSESRLERTLAMLERLTQAKPEAPQAATDEAEPVEPDAAKYTDQATYNADYRRFWDKRTEWVAKQQYKVLRQQEQQEAQRRTVEEHNRKVIETYSQRAAKVIEEYPDFSSVVARVGTPEVPLGREAFNAIVTAEAGPRIAYHLGQHPEEAQRISKLYPAQQLMELGLIAAKLAQPAPATATAPVSRAPRPIKPLGTAASAATATSSDEESMEAYAAKRTKELQAERRPGARR